MFWVAYVAMLLAVIGTAGLIGYAVGHRHGGDEQMSRVIDGFYARRTPEPPRLRIFRPVYDQDRAEA